MNDRPASAHGAVDRTALIERRTRYLSPSLRTFPLYPDDPLVLVRGEGQYVFDETGRRYLDGTAQNVCISLGFAHPVTLAMAGERMARMPAGHDRVVHLIDRRAGPGLRRGRADALRLPVVIGKGLGNGLPIAAVIAPAARRIACSGPGRGACACCATGRWPRALGDGAARGASAGARRVAPCGAGGRTADLGDGGP